MKNLILLSFLLIPMFGWTQDSAMMTKEATSYPLEGLRSYLRADTTGVYDGSKWITYKEPKPKLISFSKNDALVMSCFFGYGFIKGFADEIEYHHLAFSNRFPSLFKNNNHFFDGRYDNDGIWDAKHLAAGLQASFMTSAVCIKFYDIRHRPKKRKFIPICLDILKYDFSRRLGFFISYNVINKNKLFK